MIYFIKKFIIKTTFTILGFLSSLIIFVVFGNVFAVLDFTSDNTVGYIKDLFFTSDSKTPASSNTKIIVKGSDGSLSLSGNLILGKGMISDNSILGDDIKDGNIISSLLTNDSVTNSKILNNTITSSTIAPMSVESVDIKDKVLGSSQFDNQDSFYFKLFKDHTNSGYLFDLSDNSYLMNNIVKILKINTSEIDKQLVIGGDINGDYEVEVNGNGIVEGKLCSSGACWGNKPKEIGIMNDNRRCIGDGNSIQCDKKVFGELDYCTLDATLDCILEY
ncbi:MAG: hypothetical protein V3575_00085 [Candidatus Absconditabacteria bacterium]